MSETRLATTWFDSQYIKDTRKKLKPIVQRKIYGLGMYYAEFLFSYHFCL